MSHIVRTKRLSIRKAMATESDISLYYRLWNNPKVMIHVGFPDGLRISRDKIQRQIENSNETEFDRLLIVELIKTGEPVGECKLGKPNDDLISETDIKLLPEYWGNHYGVEIKKALIDYLFANTDCEAIKATPNKNNIASIKMQELVGGVKVSEGVYKFPENMRDHTCDVHYFEYLVNRK